MKLVLENIDKDIFFTFAINIKRLLFFILCFASLAIVYTFSQKHIMAYRLDPDDDSTVCYEFKIPARNESGPEPILVELSFGFQPYI